MYVYERTQQQQTSELELRAHHLHPALPLPILAARALDALIDPAQLERQPGAQLLQTRADALDGALDLLPVGADHGLLGLALLAEHVAVSSEKDIVALVVQRQHLPTLQVRRRGEQRPEQVRGQQA